ncbi:MFS transporter [Arthrobacter zhaoguopingii]|uniref:MFS transporter n=1 Tax=Arthrobacter zhaoguopingii TaxID=2681491 RepID=UPI001356D4BF|nr:MFS transporter [Arthrobacter zhaoguopingii]
MPPRTSADARWWVLAALSATQLLLVLDSTIMNVALPATQTALGFSNADRPWVITAYALAFGSVLLIGGRLADIIGRKRLLLLSLAGFIMASLLGGLSGGFETLVISRALQGIAAALMAPTTLSLLSTAFADIPARGKAFGIFGAVSSSGSAIGLILGGLLTQYLTWRWCLLINVLVGAAITVMVIKILPPDASAPRQKVRPDTLGAITSGFGMFAIVYGLTIAESRSWADPLTIGSIVTGLALLVLFVATENKAAHPILPMRVVLQRDRGGAYLMVAIAGIGMFGAFLFLTYHLQTVSGLTPLATGLAFLPMVIMLVIGAIVAGSVLLPRVGARTLAIAGLVTAAVGTASFTFIDADSTYTLSILPGLIVAGIGFGLIFGPAMNLATLGVDSTDAGAASAMVNVAQQIGAAVGTALLNTVALGATASYLSTHPAPADTDMDALIHGNTVAFWATSGILLTGALICGPLITRRVNTLPADHPDKAPTR